MKEGQVITKQLLLAFCLCSKCRFQIYTDGGTIYIHDTKSDIFYYIAWGICRLSKSGYDNEYLKSKLGTSIVEQGALEQIMKKREYRYFD
jgi:hypothetical protein